MPLSLPAPTRRKFLTGLGAAIVSFPLGRSHAAELDEDLIAILNDPHIGEPLSTAYSDPQVLKKVSADSEHLKAAVDWLLALPKRPAAVLINGDLALTNGRIG